jgi:hypothetical protein
MGRRDDLAGQTVPTYRQLFAIREFRVLFVNRCVVMISVAASGLALGTITYDDTRSPVLTGLSMFGGPLVSDALQCVPGLPWQLRFLLLAIPYVVNSMFSGTQWVIVHGIGPPGPRGDRGLPLRGNGRRDDGRRPDRRTLRSADAA